MTKKQRIYLVNVGANLAHGRDARSPIFSAHQDSFEFVTYPDSSCLQQYPNSVRPFVRDSATLRTHLDPENLTYGDNCANRRTGALRQVEPGDILLFWALLWRIPVRTHDVFATSDRGWYLIGAMTVRHVLGPGESVSPLPAKARKRALANAHVSSGRVRKAAGRHDRVFVGAPRHSRLFTAAVDLQVGDNFGLLRRTIFSKDGRDLRWHGEMEAPRWNSALRACRAVLDLSCRQDRDRAEVIRDAIYRANPGYDLLSSLPTMTVYHRTPAAAAILREGFRNSSGTYLTNRKLRGVWVSTSPLDANEGASGNALLQLEIPTKSLLKYERIESGKTYREFLLPAKVLNRFRPFVLVESEDAP